MAALLALAACGTTSDSLREDEGVLPAGTLGRSTVTVFSQETPSAPGEGKVGYNEASARGDLGSRGAFEPRTFSRGAILRVTFDRAIAVAVVPGAKKARYDVSVGSETLPATEVGRDGDFVVLSFERGGRDLRPFEMSEKPPAAKAPLLFLPRPRPGRSESRPLLCAAADEPPQGKTASRETGWLAQAPEEGERDDRAPALRAREARGGLVLDATGRLAGFLVGEDGELPRFQGAAAAAVKLEPFLLSAGGADLVRPEDGFLVRTLRVESVEGLPKCSEEEGGGPKLVLEVRVKGELASRVEVTPGRKREDALLASHEAGPVAFTLVALDRSLAKGETREELSAPYELPALVERVSLELPLRPEALARYGKTAQAARFTRARLTLTPLDPDAESGRQRSVLGASALELGRVADGRLDLLSGKATRFFAVESTEAGPVAAVLLRRRPAAALDLRAFSPGFDAFTLELEEARGGPRIALAIGRFPKGRTLLRLRQTGGEGATGYGLVVARRSDASSLVSPVFRLVAREAADGSAAHLDSDAFADEVAQALDSAGLPREQIARALADELGNRVVVARRLALALLERHFRPPRAVLEEALAPGGKAADDAGLLLAEIDPKDEKLRACLRRAARDDDPYVRARAVHVAARSGDAGFALELATALEGDRSPVVESAVLAARLAAKK